MPANSTGSIWNVKRKAVITITIITIRSTRFLNSSRCLLISFISDNSNSTKLNYNLLSEKIKHKKSKFEKINQKLL